MPMIRETIITTVDRDGNPHVAPLGLIADGEDWIVAPFRPSRTLDNLQVVPFATATHTDDVRVFAGCLTGRHDWPLAAAELVPVPRLAQALSHTELAVESMEDDPERPRIRCRALRTVTHAPFTGLNRAKAAVLEAAILVSRLNLLPRERIERELAYLQSAVDKTAGSEERQAWTWLMEKVRSFYGA
jgi:hypothetical protein